jgi:pimeloyl-ACP methyl ester carboxylesterase
MPFVQSSDVALHYQETGSGHPVVFCHEYATDLRAWEPQMRHFGRRYRAIAWNYRGYPPSSVPLDDHSYEHRLLIEDLHQVLDSLGIDRAHLVGIATGGNLALNYAIAHPERVDGLVVVGAGAGTSDRDNWLRACVRLADDIASRGVEAVVEAISSAPQRVVFRDKDPTGWTRFLSMMRDLSPLGAEKLMRVTLTGRLPVSALHESLTRLTLPILVMMGDQDYPAHEACRFIRDHAPHAGLATLPMCGHTLNSEEPALFNRLVEDFLAAVDAGRWGTWQRTQGDLLS